MSAGILECDQTEPHLAHLWFGILGNYACVGVGLRLVTGGSTPETIKATATNDHSE